MRLKTYHFKTTIQIVTINGTTLVENKYFPGNYLQCQVVNITTIIFPTRVL